MEVKSIDKRESSKDKSSLLDSDKDLDTAMKYLLQFKWKLKRRPQPVCRKNVRFKTTKTWALGQQGGFQRGWKDGSPHLKNCLSWGWMDVGRGRKSGYCNSINNFFENLPLKVQTGQQGGLTEETFQHLLQLDRGKRVRQHCTCGCASAFLSGQTACGGHVFSSEAEAHHLHCSLIGPGSQFDDSSFMDSDNNIKLEISKFLAKKAKDSIGQFRNSRNGVPPYPGWRVCPGHNHCAQR